MTPDFSAATFPVLIRTLRERLQTALATAKAAEAYLEEADREGALAIALEVELPLTEAQTLLGAAAIIQRHSRDR